jgi:formiminotetrahydrofolate cyclodeaminase
MYTKKTVRDYVSSVAAREPVPGGGSVAALAASLGAGLTSMVCNYTAGNPKFAEADAAARRILAQADALRERLLELVDKDTQVYAEVTSAYRLPRGTDAEKAARREAIQQALVAAAAVPMEIGRASREVALLCKELVDIGNPNLVSDVGVGVLLADAALRGAALNVEINAASIKDPAVVAGLRAFVDQALPEVAGIAGEVMQKTLAAIAGRAG